MTPFAISLIQETFAKIDPQKDTFAKHFYEDLFATAPETRPYFDGKDMDEQGTKLMAAMATVVNGLNDIEGLIPKVEEVAKQHVAYGVQPGDYDTFGASLMRTLARTLEDDFHQEAKMAWDELYNLLATVMKFAAYEDGGRGFKPARPAGQKPFWKFW